MRAQVFRWRDKEKIQNGVELCIAKLSDDSTQLEESERQLLDKLFEILAEVVKLRPARSGGL